MKFNKANEFRLLNGLVLVGVILAIGSVRGDESNDSDLSRLEVTIPQGTLRGVDKETRLGRTIAAFLKIPYAQPPVGELRFEAPLGPTAWNGTLVANTDGPACPQFESLIDRNSPIIGDEDCLYLNVFTPKLPTKTDKKLLPVMVYIFGGIFTSGVPESTTYGHHYILDKDVVLVIPNYRLGVFGFLSTGDEVAPGNYGLKDLVAAFQWVHDNVEYFGGDPNQVTLFGHSSGAVSAHLLALSPLMDGLFHRFITQSASALGDWSHYPKETYGQHAYGLGDYLGCSTNTSSELMTCLKSTNISDLIRYTPSSSHALYDYRYMTWLPTIESDVEGAFMTDSPRNLFAAGKIPDLPWMTGVTRDEGCSISACHIHYTSTLANYTDTVLDYITQYYDQPFNKTTCDSLMKAYYLSDLSDDTDTFLTNLGILMGDSTFTYPVWNGVQRQAAIAKNPVYFYTFNYVDSISQTLLNCGSEIYGVRHADELTYMWNLIDTTFSSLNKTLSDTDVEMIQIMVDLWTSFAIHGVPLTSPETGTTIWEPYTLAAKNVLRIGEGRSVELVPQDGLHEERMHFWDEYYATMFSDQETLS